MSTLMEAFEAQLAEELRSRFRTPHYYEDLDRWTVEVTPKVNRLRIVPRGVVHGVHQGYLDWTDPVSKKLRFVTWCGRQVTLEKYPKARVWRTFEDYTCHACRHAEWIRAGRPKAKS